MSSVTAPPQASALESLAGGSWAFAIRVWLAIVLALYVSFWLELESPSSAAITVAILALPSRGLGLEKAVFRLGATVVGVFASIAIVGIFAQSDLILLAAFAVWIGLCVFTVGMFDGNRAYAASLGVTTVAICAIQLIDNPQQVFDTGIARGSAIAIGALAITFVNDILAAPDHHPKVAVQLQGLFGQVRDHAKRAMLGEAMPAPVAANLLRDITMLRPEVASLVTESSSGPVRSSAARTAMVALAAQLSMARALAVLTRLATSGTGDAFERRPDDAGDRRLHLMSMASGWLMQIVVQRQEDVRRSLEALQEGAYPPRQLRAPLYRSRRIAAAAGIRAVVYFALASFLLSIAGWPASAFALTFVAVLIALGAPVPDARVFTKLAVMVAPMACLLAGILVFVVLNGSSGFPMLALGLAPFMIGCGLLMTSRNLILVNVGRLNMVFILALGGISNPQSYNPETFLFACLFACLATWLLFAFQIILPPMSGPRQVRQLLVEARRDLGKCRVRRHHELALEEAIYRNGTRVGQIAVINGAVASDHRALDEAMRCFDEAAALRLCADEIGTLDGGAFADMAKAAGDALVRRDGKALMACAEAMQERASSFGLTVPGACPALVVAAVMIGEPSRDPRGEGAT